MQVKWKTQLSDRFTVGNGVRKGSFLSPSFNIYIEDLMRLKNCGYGAIGWVLHLLAAWLMLTM